MPFQLTGFSVPTKIELPNIFQVTGFSALLPYVFFDQATIIDEIGGRSIDSISNARLVDSLNVAPYPVFSDLVLNFSVPPASNETNFDFGNSPAFVTLIADVSFTQAGYSVPARTYQIPLKFLTIADV